jgi:hypothetical protein
MNKQEKWNNKQRKLALENKSKRTKHLIQQRYERQQKINHDADIALGKAMGRYPMPTIKNASVENLELAVASMAILARRRRKK